MKPDVIQLPDFVLAEIFKNSLVSFDILETEPELVVTAPEEIQAKELPESKAVLKFLGENKKNIAVLVDEPNALIINEHELDFLSKILTACGFTIADIVILNKNKQNINYAALKEQFDTKFLLLFGIDPSFIKLPFSIPHFQVQNYAGCTIVYAPVLSSMMQGDAESVSLKRQLWASLKATFQL